MTAGSVAVPTIIPLKAPSGPKHVVDSATEIELQSATNDVLIFYTLNGTRPEPCQRLGERHTFVYTTTFTLPTGKATIKALASSRDRTKQSSVVTKSFIVHEAEEESETEGEGRRPFPLSPSPSPSISTQLRHRLSLGSSRTRVTANPEASPETLPRSTSAPLAATTKSVGLTTPPLSTTDATRLSSLASASRPPRPPAREKPRPVCVYCNAPRSRDPHYKYCTHCGSRLPPLPKTDTTPPHQMAVCSNCRAEMPPETSVCVLCEGRVARPEPPPAIHSQADTRHQMKDKSICLSCGTANPRDLQACITCEQPLSPIRPPSPLPLPAPPLPAPTTMRPVAGSSFVMCGTCGRVNVSDARFCDWCGSKPEGSQLSAQCASCSASNTWHSRHCYSCGALIKAPPRPGVELSSTMKIPHDSEFPKSSWVPVVELEYEGPAVKSQGTQTQGIFYPSARTMGSSKGAEPTSKVASRDRLPKLDAYSPGKGLWRMQVDHVCTHLKAYSLSSSDFQASIGDPQMGKLVRAEVKQEESELNLHLTFCLRESNHESSRGGYSIRSAGSLRSASVSSVESTAAAPPLRRTSQKKLRRYSKASVSKPSGETQQLLRELSAGGEGRQDVVEELVQKGASVCAVDGSGRPPLSLAAANGHMECIAVLVDNGADVNTQAKSTGNTALHEAVLKGLARLNCIEALLGHSANARLRNKAGETPSELAVKLRHDTIVTCFATHVGAELLDKLTKVQPSLTL